MNPDYHSKFLWIVAVMILCVSLVLYYKSNKKSAKVFSFFSLMVMVWSVLYGFYIATSNYTTALVIIKVNHVLGLFASLGFVSFSYYYTDKIINRLFIYTLSCYTFIISLLILFSESVITDIYSITDPDRWGWHTGMLYPLYIFTFIVFWIFTLSKILSNTKYTSGLDKINHKFMFYGLLLGIIPPFLLNILLPYFGTYGISWTGPIFSSIWIFVIGYSIMIYQQMNVRLVIIEIIAIAMSAMLLMNIFIQAEIGRVENIILFITFISLSVTLIRTVISEVKSKQMLKLLNDTLEQKVQEQTSEIRQSLENEREARMELEKLNTTKNQFVLITQHGIRGPIQTVSAISENLIKLIPKTKQKAIKDELEDLNISISRLEKINQDFLNVAGSNSNDKILNLNNHNLLDIVNEVVSELSLQIRKKKIEVTINRNERDWIVCSVDKIKMYNALLIIFENAIKYNSRNGKIIVDSKVENGNQTICIIDSGIGLEKEEINKLNSSHFYRGVTAKELNPFGMGIGISVARAIVEAHHGSLQVSSLGQNQGTVVKMIIPRNFLENNLDLI